MLDLCWIPILLPLMLRNCCNSCTPKSGWNMWCVTHCGSPAQWSPPSYFRANWTSLSSSRPSLALEIFKYMLATPLPLLFFLLWHNLICLVVRNCSCLQWLRISQIDLCMCVRVYVCGGNGEMSPRRRNESDCSLRKGKWMLRLLRRGRGGGTSIQTIICNCICEYTHTRAYITFVFVRT